MSAVRSNDGRATGVLLSSGEEIGARVVVSALDPKRTLLQLVDPEDLGPTLVWRASNIRTPGCTAAVTFALSGVPRFAGSGGEERIRGRIVIAPGIDYLERGADAAKYGRTSAEPYLQATIPSLVDPTLKSPKAMRPVPRYSDSRCSRLRRSRSRPGARPRSSSP